MTRTGTIFERMGIRPAINSSVGRRTAPSVAAALEPGSPSISCVTEGSTLIFCMDVIPNEEIPIVGAALCALMEPNE